MAFFVAMRQGELRARDGKSTVGEIRPTSRIGKGGFLKRGDDLTDAVGV